MAWGGKRPNSGRKPGPQTGRPINNAMSIPAFARTKTHKAIKILDTIMSRGYLPIITRYEDPDGTRHRKTEFQQASVALRAHCAEVLIERGHGKPAQAVAVVGDEPGGRSLRDLILASMDMEDEDEPLTIEHKPLEGDDEPDDI